jgi:hypothetical protein
LLQIVAECWCCRLASYSPPQHCPSTPHLIAAVTIHYCVSKSHGWSGVHACLPSALHRKTGSCPPSHTPVCACRSHNGGLVRVCSHLHSLWKPGSHERCVSFTGKGGRCSFDCSHPPAKGGRLTAGSEPHRHKLGRCWTTTPLLFLELMARLPLMTLLSLSTCMDFEAVRCGAPPLSRFLDQRFVSRHF